LRLFAVVALALCGVQCSASSGGASGAQGDAGPTFGGITSATDVDDTHVGVAWNPATDPATPAGSIAYRVYAGVIAGGEDFTHPLVTTPAGATGATVAGLLAATTYYFVVRAVDAQGFEDTNTVERSATTPDKHAPRFAGVRAVEGTDTDKVLVSWNPCVDESGQPCSYDIYYSTTAGQEDFTTPSTVAPAGSTEYTMAGLEPYTTYYVVVRAVGPTGLSDANDRELAGTTLDKTPPTFGGAEKAVAAGTTITVNWLPASDPVDPPIVYNVYRATTPGGEDFSKPTFTTATDALSYEATGLSFSTTYYFVVRAQDVSKNEDTNVVEVSATTAPAFTGLTSVGNPTPTSLDLTWGLAYDNATPQAAITFDVFQSSGPGGENYASPTYKGIAQTAGTTNTYTVKGLNPNTNYCFVVRAVDQLPDSNTHEVCATTLQIPAPTFTSQPYNSTSTFTSITMSWAASVTPTSNITYGICVTATKGACASGPFTPVGTNATYTLNGLPVSTVAQTYYFVVQATDNGGSTISSQGMGSTTADATPPPTTAFNSTTTWNFSVMNELQLSWNAVSDPVTPTSSMAYEIVVSTCNSSPTCATDPQGSVVADYTTPAGATSTTITAGLVSNTAYQCQIRAINIAGAKSAYNPAPTYSAGNPAFVCMTGTSYSANVLPVFAVCNGCHAGGNVAPAPGPYSAAFFVSNPHVPGGASAPCSTANFFVVSGSPSQSLIYLRMANLDAYYAPACTDFGTAAYRMPQGGPYLQGNINTIYDWITQGLDSLH
jgi:hypothetical protein